MKLLFTFPGSQLRKSGNTKSGKEGWLSLEWEFVQQWWCMPNPNLLLGPDPPSQINA